MKEMWRQAEIGPYPISYRSIIPKQAEATNLLVPVCLSATHIAYGSIRMEPVFMVLGQSAAVAASLAIDAKQPVQEINVNKLKDILKNDPLADGSLSLEVMVDNEDSANIIIKGSWSTGQEGCYGPTMLLDDSMKKIDKAVQFFPTIPKTGKYQIYSYFPVIKNGTSVTCLQVFDGKNKKNIYINKDDVKVAGQTSGEWVQVGLFQLPAGEKAYVEISNKNATGIVVADAVLLVPVK